MDFSIKFSLSLLISLIMVTFFLYNLTDLVKSYEEKPLMIPTVEIESQSPINQLPKPTLKIQEIKLSLNQPFNLLDFVDAQDSVDGNIKEHVRVYHNIDITQRGIYNARFIVKNSNKMTAEKLVKVRVD